MRSPVVVLLIVVFAAGCSDGLTCPEDSWGDPNDLEISFFVEPSIVRPADTLYAYLRIYNPTACTVTLGGGSSCVHVLRAFRGREPMVLQGTGWGCSGPPPDGFPIEAWDSIARTHQIIASVNVEPPQEWAPAPPGIYTLVAVLLLHGLPDQQDYFIVVE